MTNMKQYIESGNWKAIPRAEDRKIVTDFRQYIINDTLSSAIFDDLLEKLSLDDYITNKKPPELDQELMDYLLS